MCLQYIPLKLGADACVATECRQAGLSFSLSKLSFIRLSVVPFSHGVVTTSFPPVNFKMLSLKRKILHLY